MPSSGLHHAHAFLSLGLALILTGILSLGHSQEPRRIPYIISPKSQLYLEGTSNVKDFTCRNTLAFRPSQVAMGQVSGNCITLNTRLQLPIRALDCGNYGINRDMQATLQAKDYPYIDIQLLNVTGETQLGETSQQEWHALRAQVVVSIAGKSQTMEVPVRARQATADTYRFTGSCPLQMTTFGIDPPSALLGLVQVSDDIQIYFDLIVTATGG
ncbi:MAG: YceI family protein [Bacteroidetes bacterium]|nr:MAG: YceI family protein [Bacteroidota bacterium]